MLLLSETEPSYALAAPSAYAYIPSLREEAPVFNWSTPSVSAGIASLNCCVPSCKDTVPSASWFAASSNEATVFFKSSKVISSAFISERRLDVATDIVISSEKSLTSAVNSKYSGISRSSDLSLNLRFIVSLSPGIVIPTATILSPTLVSLPLVISTFENTSVGSIMPVIIVNGTATVCFLPLIVTVFF